MNVLHGRRGAAIVDDSYNANPASARAALDYLAAVAGRRLLVLGDMAELGAQAQSLHEEVGRYARGRCDELFTIGELAAHAAAAFGPAALSCADVDAAEAAIAERLGPDLCVLIKGSRVMGLERLVAKLVDPDASRSAPC
jgi:UDP-N-acetylmuramoyl-tripeptide--D-alanyl-D-alanine ligase